MRNEGDGADQEDGLVKRKEKSFKKTEKRIDKEPKVCYNSKVETGCGTAW